jgi:hypothetical protein
VDTLRVKGISKKLDGDYECDLVAIAMDVSSDESLTMREAHTVKRISGVRGGEIIDAVAAGDTDVLLALSIVVLQRHNKQVDENQLWDAKVGAFEFVLGQEPDGEGEDDADPPTVPAGTSAGESSTDGGATGSPKSEESPAADQSPTGRQV